MNTLTHQKQAIIIACNLKKIREKSNLTQNQVAELAGIRRDIYAKYETGVSLMSILNLVKVAKALNQTVDDLLFGILETLEEEA